VISGNCQLMKTLVYQRMPKLHHHFASIGIDVYNVALKWLMVREKQRAEMQAHRDAWGRQWH